jgi:shikimate 5-dehydrogenase
MNTGEKMFEVLENDPFALLGQHRPRWISGIVGGKRPSRYSESPALWNELFLKLGLDAAFLTFDLPRPEDMATFMKSFLDEPDTLDLTVTNPYKAIAWQELSRLVPPNGMTLEVSSRVDTLGCLNHVIVDREKGRLIAENTDGVGMHRALEAAYASTHPGAPAQSLLAGRRVLLVGSGGAAASIGLELVRSGVKLTIVDLAAADARALAARLAPFAAAPIEAGDWNLIAQVAPRCEVIVSAITVGVPIGAAGIARLPPDILFADARYGEAAHFARAAAEAGRLSTGHVIDGRAMLFGQFAAAAALACSIVGIDSVSFEQAVSAMTLE